MITPDPVDDPTNACTVERGSQFGHSLAAGDLDGDGVQDLVIGEPRRPAGDGAMDPGALDGGAAWILWGPVPRTTARVTELPHRRLDTEYGLYDWFGADVAIPGDLNGDGHLDLAVVAPGVGLGDAGCWGALPGSFESFSEEPDAQGAIYLWFGPLSRDGGSAADARIVLDSLWDDDPLYTDPYGGFGSLEVNVLGDVDEDGYDDLVLNRRAAFDAHYSYIFRGGPGF